MLPRISTISPKGGERSKAADAQAVRRQTTVTRAPRSRARLQHEPTRRRLVAKPRTPHLHCAACAVLQAANCQCRGSRGTPLVLLWGIQRGYSLREENTPFALRPHGSGWGTTAFFSRERKWGVCYAAAYSAASPSARCADKGVSLLRKRIPPLPCVPTVGGGRTPRPLGVKKENTACAVSIKRSTRKKVEDHL